MDILGIKRRKKAKRALETTTTMKSMMDREIMRRKEINARSPKMSKKEFKKLALMNGFKAEYCGVNHNFKLTPIINFESDLPPLTKSELLNKYK